MEAGSLLDSTQLQTEQNGENRTISDVNYELANDVTLKSEQPTLREQESREMDILNQVAQKKQISDKPQSDTYKEEERKQFKENQSLIDQQDDDSEDSFLKMSEDEAKQNESEDSRKFEEEDVINDSEKEDSEEFEQQSLRDSQDDKQEEKKQERVYKIRPKKFQMALFTNSLNKNSIIYLPTGTGKTMVAILSMFYYLHKDGRKKKIVFLANTIQLVKQQADAIRIGLKHIFNNQELSDKLKMPLGDRYIQIGWNQDNLKNQVCCIHGQKNDELGMTRRKKIQNNMMSKKQFLSKINKSTVVVMISQMFLNCLRRGYINLTDFSFVVLDECHHCTGQHPYAGIMNEFYFQKKKQLNQKQENATETKQKLPVIMGLTASPVAQPYEDINKLIKEIEKLCCNLDSVFAFYNEVQNLKNETDIEIMPIIQPQQRQLIPYLIEQFKIYRDHRESFHRLKTHFPSYYNLIKRVVDYLASQDKTLAIQVDKRQIVSLQHLVFYDLKECLLIKLRDLWLELGDYALVMGLNDLVGQLERISFKTPSNTTIMNQVIQIVKQYRDNQTKQMSKCVNSNFSTKLNKLISILQTKTNKNIENNENNEYTDDFVLVFAFERRTVKYLEKVLLKYKESLPEEQRKNFQCVGVTGYAVKAGSSQQKDGHSYESDPSSERYEKIIAKQYDQFIEEKVEDKKLTSGENQGLTSEMKKLLSQKMGKLLLEVEQKHSRQIKKIQDFKNKRYRVLITTSVTEQGFDIPGCNTVISFDTPSSLKSYIQIKGRARKRHSKYYIFTSDYKKTLQNKDHYENTINMTNQIAINGKGLSQNFLTKNVFKPQQGYRFSPVKATGAIINTNYALELLKSFLSTLRHPNKAYYHYNETPGVCYRCFILFPPSCPSSARYIIGDPYKRKVTALKSAAYKAVIQLYKQGFIKADLRPKRFQEMEEERQVEKYQDIHRAREDPHYMQILLKYSQIELQVEKQGEGRKFMRFYFKPIQGIELDFPQINYKFKEHLPTFQTNPFKFQLYHIKFSNNQNIPLLNQGEHTEIGIITCFDEDSVKEIFEGFQYAFQQASNQKFSFKLISEILLKSQQYQRLRNVHNFLIAASQNRQIQHYSILADAEPVYASWRSQVNKKNGYDVDPARKHHPLIVLLKTNGQKVQSIDHQLNKKILEYEKIFKNLYIYHNTQSKVYQKMFQATLRDIFNNFLTNLENKQPSTLVQSITKDFCFHKCLIVRRENLTKEIQALQKEKKGNLQIRHLKMTKMYDHMNVQNNQVVKVKLWRKYQKQVKNQYFKRTGAFKLIQEQSSSYYLLKQFLPYPISLQTLFKVSLAGRYSFKALYEYSLAFHFRNVYLNSLLQSRIIQSKKQQQFQFKAYPNIILQNSDRIFNYLFQSGGSSYLKNIGELSEKGSMFIPPQVSFEGASMSSINNSHITGNSSSLNISLFAQQIGKEESYSPIKYLKIMDIKKVLTSRIYKQGIHNNYEEYQFIGDVVLKLLSTIQVFLKKPDADEGALHIARANIICNANLHRKSIKHKMFRYILAGKLDEPPPPCRIAYDSLKVQRNYYEDTKIEKVNSASQAEGYQYIPGKVHADVVEALIGAFYLNVRSLEECQALLYSLQVLKKPNIDIVINSSKRGNYELPALYSDFEKRINYTFQDKGLLIQSFTHSSFRSIIETLVDDSNLKNLINKNKSLKDSMSIMNQSINNQKNKSRLVSSETFYERLEFLGDSIIDLVVVEFIYEKYQNALDEGTFTLLKQAGVSNKTLGMIALSLGMHQLILMDIPESDEVLKQFNRIKLQFNLYLNNPQDLLKLKVHSLKLLGDVFESLVGAIFIDTEMNYPLTKKIIMDIAGDYISNFTEIQKLNIFPGYKFRQYLDKNNYRKYRIQKDTNAQTKQGLFRFILVDRVGNIIAECYEANQKKAWDLIEEEFIDNNLLPKQL